MASFKLLCDFDRLACILVTWYHQIHSKHTKHMYWQLPDYKKCALDENLDLRQDISPYYKQTRQRSIISCWNVPILLRLSHNCGQYKYMFKFAFNLAALAILVCQKIYINNVK
jgi:hypothetical protein